MFGSLRPQKTLNKKDRDEDYQRSYCGLCQELKSEHGLFSTSLLTYDLTFFSHYWRLVSVPIQDQSAPTSAACSALPWKQVKTHSSEHLGQRVAAHLSVVLAKAKFEDDDRDEPGLKSKLLNRLIAGPGQRAEHALRILKFPVDDLLDILRSQAEMEDRLAKMPQTGNLSARLNQASQPTALSCRTIFGWLAEQVFPADTEALLRHQEFGQSLGKAIYLRDALEDRAKDAKNCQFNVFRDEAIVGARKIVDSSTETLRRSWRILSEESSAWSALDSSIQALCDQLCSLLPAETGSQHPSALHRSRKKQAAVLHCHETQRTGECFCEVMDRCWWAAGQGRREREMEKLQEELNPSPIRKAELSAEELSLQRVTPLPYGSYACPGCQTEPMERVEIARGGLFYCQSCGGVWLFKNHLQQIKSHPEAREYIRFPQDARPPSVMAGQRRCPIHQSILEITRAQGVTVEECEACEAWYLDAGELGSLV